MNLANFKNNFSGGSRANRFSIKGKIPNFSSEAGSPVAGEAFTEFHVRSTVIPQLTTTALTYDWFGRKYHYPGEKQYGTWAFTVLDDNSTQDGDLWGKFHAWQDAINSNVDNLSFQAYGSSNEGSDSAKYKADNWIINHLDINGESYAPLKQFIMHGCWPTTIQPISFNMANVNTPNQFVVVIIYDYIELADSGGYITN